MFVAMFALREPLPVEKGVTDDGRDYGCRNCHDTEREAMAST